MKSLKSYNGNVSQPANVDSKNSRFLFWGLTPITPLPLAYGPVCRLSRAARTMSVKGPVQSLTSLVERLLLFVSLPSCPLNTTMKDCGTQVIRHLNMTISWSWPCRILTKQVSSKWVDRESKRTFVVSNHATKTTDKIHIKHAQFTTHLFSLRTNSTNLNHTFDMWLYSVMISQSQTMIAGFSIILRRYWQLNMRYLRFSFLFWGQG